MLLSSSVEVSLEPPHVSLTLVPPKGIKGACTGKADTACSQESCRLKVIRMRSQGDYLCTVREMLYYDSVSGREDVSHDLCTFHGLSKVKGRLCLMSTLRATFHL